MKQYPKIAFGDESIGDGAPFAPRLCMYWDSGPSSDAKANEAAQTAFYNQMTQEQSTTFGEQQDILNTLKTEVMPTLKAGPEQYGFSAAEDATLQGLINQQEKDVSGSITTQGQLLRTGIENQGAIDAANLVSGTELSQLQKSGGTQLPSGGNAQVEEIARDLGAQSTSANINAEKINEANAQTTAKQQQDQQLLAEKTAGYSAGAQNYAQALGATSGVAQTYNPIGVANSTSNAGSNATSAVHLTDSENSNLLSSVLGGVVGGAANTLTGGLATSFTNMNNPVGNLFS